MQREPDGAVAVLGQFNEVVATAQGSQGQAPVPVVLVGRRAGLFGEDLEMRTRSAAVAVSFALFLPALMGIRHSMPARTAAGAAISTRLRPVMSRRRTVGERPFNAEVCQ